MATLLHKVTMELRANIANIVSFDSSVWLINPDLSAVSSVSSDYWKVVDDLVVEMTTEEKNVVDATKLAEEKAVKCERLRVETRDFIYSRYAQERQQTLAVLRTEARLDGLTNRANYIGQVLVWMNSVLGHFYTHYYTIQAQPTRAAVQAYTWDFTDLVTADPIVTIETANGIPD